MVRDGTPPLYQSLLYAWTHLFGVSDYIVRFPSAVFALITIIVAFVYGRKIIGVNQSLLLAALLAVSWGTIGNAHEARGYSLLMLFSVILMLQSQKLVLHHRKPETLSRMLFFIFLSGLLLCYTHYFGALLYFANLAVLFFFLKKSRKKIAIMAVLSFLSFIPWLYVFLNHHDLSQPFWIAKKSLWAYTRLLSEIAFYRTDLSFVVFVVIIFLLIIQPTKNRLHIIKTISFPFLVIVAIIVGALAINELKPLIIMRYMIIVLPYIYLVISTILSEPLISNKNSGSKIMRFIPLILIIVIVSSLGYNSIKTYAAMEKEDWRGAAQFIIQKKNIDKIYCVNGSRYYWHYLRGSGIDSNKLIEVKPKNLELAIRPSDSGTILVLWGAHNMGNYQILKDSISARGFEIIEERVFGVNPGTPSVSNKSKCFLFK